MKYTITFFILLTIFSCSKRKKVTESIESQELSKSQIDSILTSFKFQYEKPIIIDSINQTIIPISTELFERRKTFSREGYYTDDFPRYWNILFKDSLNNSDLLTKEKIRISNFYIKKDLYNEENKILKGKIIYTINDTDYNNDKELNSFDPEGLFYSDLDGSNFNRISPKNEDLQQFEIINQKTLIYQTLRDTKQDSIFNTYDKLIWYKAIFTGTGTGKQWKSKIIIDFNKQNEIEKLYFDKWLKKQK